MEISKLKSKVGIHEFDAEGPTEMVQAQYERWLELVSKAPSAGILEVAGTPLPLREANRQAESDADLQLNKITRLDGRVVSLTARGETIEDEILLILYAQKMLRQNEGVTGAEIIRGLKDTGRVVPRVDYPLDKLQNAGQTLTIGKGRASKYRLTNQGTNRARELARALIEHVG